MEWNEGPDGLVDAYRRARWGWIAGVWGGVFGFEIVRHCLEACVIGRDASVWWLVVAGMSLALWAVFTPLMLWLGRQLPIDGKHCARNLAVHGVAMLGCVALDAAMQSWMLGNTGRTAFAPLMFTLMVIDGFSYAAVIAIGHVQRSNARYRERVRAQAALDQELTAARLRALEMQLQPHFLFNTLHAVGTLVRSARSDDAVRSLATLGGLLRATLADGDHEIALDDELALADRYLELQKIRFADRLQIEIDVAPGVTRAKVPRLILQPLLENSIRHGVEHSRTAVSVEVRARARGDRLELMVCDRGGTRGRTSRGQGIGLANTRARLAALYGEAQCLELESSDGGGLTVRIEIPLALASEASQPVLALEAELVGVTP